MSSLHFNPLKCVKTDWENSREIILNLRESPALKTDQTASHFISYLNDSAIACISLHQHDNQYYLYGLSVSREYQQLEADHALMRCVIKYATEINISTLQVEYSKETEAFFKKYNFLPQEKKRKFLALQLPPSRHSAYSGSELLPLSNLDDFQQYSHKLIGLSQRRLAIFTYDIEPAIFDNEDICQQLLKFIQSSRHAEIRILIKDSQHLLQRSHALLRLYQRSHTQIKIKKISLNPEAYLSGYLLSDDCRIIFRKDEQQYRGVCYTNNRPRVKQQLEAFNILWNSALVDPGLQQLTF